MLKKSWTDWDFAKHRKEGLETYYLKEDQNTEDFKTKVL